jgi:DNA-directed RNA polymerase specialized sigma24 family protein
VPGARTARRGARTSPDHWGWSQIRLRCRVGAVRILRRDHDAEEVVQEALARAWRGRRSCRNPEGPLAWCLQITRNEACHLISQQQRATGEALDAGSELADEHRWSHAQIAARLDIPEATARVRLRRAQKRLRSLLDESD